MKPRSVDSAVSLKFGSSETVARWDLGGVSVSSVLRVRRVGCGTVAAVSSIDTCATHTGYTGG